MNYTLQLKQGYTFTATGRDLLNKSEEEKQALRNSIYARYSVYNKDGAEVSDTGNIAVIFRDFGRYMTKAQREDLKARYQ